jgi:arylsulfatase B
MCPFSLSTHHRGSPLPTSLAATLVAAILTCGAVAEERPNVVILVADDLGWADVSFHGQEIKTPNLDRLTSEGVELSRFYVCPVCTPTRAGLMTGRYPIRYGLMRAVLPPWRKGGLDLEEVTLPQVLAKAGYEHRGIFGKWHLGHSDNKYHPLRRGFTEFVGHYNGAIDYFTHQREGELDWHRDYESNYDEGYSTDLIADAAADFICRHGQDDSPFLCYVPFNAPHSPLQAKQEDLRAYEHLAKTKPFSRKRKGSANPYGGRGRGDSPRQTLAAMISSMDQGVGRILQALDDQGIADDTLVWFFSDNGGVGAGDNRPLRAGKATVFEGGIRVAAALRWPGRVAAGGKITAPTAYIDVLPTLMEVAEVDDHGGKPLDGRSLVGLLTDEEPKHDRDVYSYIGQGGENTEQITLIEPEWKLVVIGRKLTDPDPNAKRETHLFHIADDPYEKNNVAAENPEVVRRMQKKLTTFRALQPADAVPPYSQRSGNFVAPKEWQIPGT